MKFPKILKELLILILVSQQLKAIKTIEELCTNSNNFDYKGKLDKNTLEDVIANGTWKGRGQFGEVYQVEYKYNHESTKVAVALKEVKVTVNNSLEEIGSEIAYMKEFAKLDSNRFMNFYECFYVKKRYSGINVVYMMTGLLDGDVSQITGYIYNLNRKQRYGIYLNLIEDVTYFHKNIERTNLDEKIYVHMDSN